MDTNDRSGARRKRRPSKPQPKNTAPEVVYSQPASFNRRALLLRLVTILAVVIAIVMGLSIFFKIETVTVVGTDKYSAWSVSQASGLEAGDSLLFFGRAGAAGKIIRQLPYIQSVRFQITLPGTVNILVVESPMAYCVEDTAGNWWHITSQGRLTEQVQTTDGPVLKGVQIASPVAGELAVEAQAQAGVDRLATALAVCCYLEENEILGQVKSVDVTKLQSVEVWYEEQYLVKLGDDQRLDYKIRAACQAIRQMSSYQRGTLDASFTTYPDRVGYLPFTE